MKVAPFFHWEVLWMGPILATPGLGLDILGVIVLACLALSRSMARGLVGHVNRTVNSQSSPGLGMR